MGPWTHHYQNRRHNRADDRVNHREVNVELPRVVGVAEKE